MRFALRTLALAAVLVTSHAHAAVGLFNTGVDANGVALSQGAVDPHYTLSAGTRTPGALAVNSAVGFPIAPNGPWLGDSTTSAWLSPNANTQGGDNITYSYTTQFDLTGIDLNKVVIKGRWAADDYLTGVYLNGQSTGITGSGFDAWKDFSLTSGFVNGVNTLRFDVNNAFGPTGLRVEYTSTQFVAAVPEPSSIALVLAGVGAVALSRRRSR